MPFDSKELPDFARIVAELEEVADHVRHRPEINHRTAARIDAIADEIRKDAGLGARPPRKSPC
jgi:hypothetical protein